MYWFLTRECPKQFVKIYEVRIIRLSFKLFDFLVIPIISLPFFFSSFFFSSHTCIFQSHLVIIWGYNKKKYVFMWKKNILATPIGPFVALNVLVFHGFMLASVAQNILNSPLVFCTVFFPAFPAFHKRGMGLLLYSVDVFHLGIHSVTRYTMCHSACF